MNDNSRHFPEIAGPTSSRPPYSFSAAARVAFSDTDAQGIVYYGRYAPYFDVARVEYWRYLQFNSHNDPAQGEFVMRAFHIEYHAPAVFDDALEVFCRIAKVGNTSITFEYDVVAAGDTGKLLASATQTMVNIDLEKRVPIPIDENMKAKIKEFEQI